jgi:hypothetical protein
MGRKMLGAALALVVACLGSGCGGRRPLSAGSGSDARPAEDRAVEDDGPKTPADLSAGDEVLTPPPDAQLVADAPDVEPGAVDASATPDGRAPAVDAGDPWRGYLETREEPMKARNARYTECFQASRERLDAEGQSYEISPESLRDGRVLVDHAALQACLARFRELSCEELARTFQEDVVDPCPGLIVGQVPPGGACVTEHDCADRARYGCSGEGSYPCRARRCTRLSRLGERCDGGACERGLSCDDTSFLCVPVDAVTSGDGQRCDTSDGPPCRSGLFCQYDAPYSSSGSYAGTCRPRVPGLACRGHRQCAHPFRCLMPEAGAGEGRCGIGRREEERCGLQPDDVGLFGFDSDCAFGLTCLERESGLTFCSAGPRVGEPCWPDAEPACVGSFCARASGEQPFVCRSHVRAGGACEGLLCQPGLDCSGRPGDAPTCVHGPLAIIPTGGRCWLGTTEGVVCVAEAYCARVVPPDPVRGVGVCRRRPGAGAPCDETSVCEAGLVCGQDRRCRPCLP